MDMYGMTCKDKFEPRNRTMGHHRPSPGFSVMWTGSIPSLKRQPDKDNGTTNKIFQPDLEKPTGRRPRGGEATQRQAKYPFKLILRAARKKNDLQYKHLEVPNALIKRIRNKASNLLVQVLVPNHRNLSKNHAMKFPYWVVMPPWAQHANSRSLRRGVMIK